MPESFHVKLIPVGKPNRNGRIYSEEVMRQAIEEYRPRPLMVLDELVGGNGLQKVIGEVTDMTLRDGFAVAEIKYYRTELGTAYRALHESGLRVPFTIAGIGTVAEDMRVQNDYRLEAIIVDKVLLPHFDPLRAVARAKFKARLPGALANVRLSVG